VGSVVGEVLRTAIAFAADVLALWLVSKSTGSPRATLKTAALCVAAMILLVVVFAALFSRIEINLLTGPLMAGSGIAFSMYVVMRVYAITFLPALWLMIAVSLVHFVIANIFPALG